MKQELQVKVNEQELTLTTLELNVKVVKAKLFQLQAQLQNASKPIITADIVDQIRDVIEESMRNSNLTDPGSYEADFEIDYNNSIVLGGINFNDQDQLSESISDGIENIFNIIEN
jgi:hypothetical protein|tara:strand:+ start:73 stop:417 length:345 start_codon:yes stop_codon:yes gene_type:complete